MKKKFVCDAKQLDGRMNKQFLHSNKQTYRMLTLCCILWMNILQTFNIYKRLLGSKRNKLDILFTLINRHSLFHWVKKITVKTRTLTIFFLFLRFLITEKLQIDFVNYYMYRFFSESHSCLVWYLICNLCVIFIGN